MAEPIAAIISTGLSAAFTSEVRDLVRQAGYSVIRDYTEPPQPSEIEYPAVLLFNDNLDGLDAVAYMQLFAYRDVGLVVFVDPPYIAAINRFETCLLTLRSRDGR